MRIAPDESLDPDDCLAQMILHELCHALIEGPESFERPDWGLDNTGERDVVREHACLRLQAALTAAFGLREVLAPTTDFREFHDSLDADPLTPPHDPSVIAAVLGLQRVNKHPWGPHLLAALEATATIAREVAGHADPDQDGVLPSLWREVVRIPPRHPSGLFAMLVDDESRTCGNCVWHRKDDLDERIFHCRAANTPVRLAWQACAHWETGLDCLECGACCRAAYHSVTVERDDPVVEAHPEIIVDRDDYVELRRDGDRCAMLVGGDDGGKTPYTCKIYESRPVPCRDFELGSDNCLIARRRVGLSR
jgi:hypothetical protein